MVLTIQNGLGAGDDVAAFVPKSQIILGVAEFGASMMGPAHAAHTSMKQIRLGLMQGPMTTGYPHRRRLARRRISY